MIVLFQWLLGIFIVSFLLLLFYRRYYDYPIIRVVYSLIGFFGVFIHELAHFIFLNLSGVRTKGFKIHYYSRNAVGKKKAGPHGSVGIPGDSDSQMTFLQALFGSIAPLVVCTFLFMFCLDIIFKMVVPEYLTILAIIFAGSLLIGSSPSVTDLKNIGDGFRKDPHYSWYQLVLIILSLITVQFFIDTSIFILPYEVLYYIADFLAVIFLYFIYKYLLLLMKALYTSIFGQCKITTEYSIRKRRFNPKKPSKKERKWW